MIAEIRHDPLTELSCRLKQPIPTGEPFVEWLLDHKAIPTVVDALLWSSWETTNQGEAYHLLSFSWKEVTIAIHDLSRGMWSPTEGYLQQMYKSQGGTAEVAAPA